MRRELELTGDSTGISMEQAERQTGRLAQSTNDLLLSGVIDSFGILEMISAIEQEFQIQVDLALLDAEDITRIGSLARYIAATANRS